MSLEEVLQRKEQLGTTKANLIAEQNLLIKRQKEFKEKLAAKGLENLEAARAAIHSLEMEIKNAVTSFSRLVDLIDRADKGDSVDFSSWLKGGETPKEQTKQVVQATHQTQATQPSGTSQTQALQYQSEQPLHQASDMFDSNETSQSDNDPLSGFDMSDPLSGFESTQEITQPANDIFSL